MGIRAFQGWFTMLIVFPISIPISTPSPADPRWPKMDLNSSNLSIMLLTCASSALRSQSWAYDWSSVGNLHVESNLVHTSATTQNCNPEIVSTLKFAEVSWVHRKRLRQTSTHILFPSETQQPSVSIDRRIWCWLDTRDHLPRHFQMSWFSSVGTLCKFQYSDYFLPWKCYTGWICRTACTLKACLTIPSEPMSVSVHPFCGD